MSERSETPRIEKCKESVMPATGFPRPYRCRFSAWKDGYCKIHHPESVKARDEKQRKKYEADRANSPYFLLTKANERIEQLESELAECRRDAESEQRWATYYAQKMHASNVALQNLEQAYSNKHSPQHRESCLVEARAVLAATDAAMKGK